MLLVELVGAAVAGGGAGLLAGERLYRWRLLRTLRRISTAKPAPVEPLDPARLAKFLERQGVDGGT